MKIIKTASFLLQAKKKSKKKNEYAICTTSIGEKEGTTKRSEWSEDATQRYKKCLKDINPKKHKKSKMVKPFKR